QKAQALQEQAKKAKDDQLIGAAASAAIEGDVAITEQKYLQAADLFALAAELVPPEYPDKKNAYVSLLANAFYRQGDEKGQNEALSSAIRTWRSISYQRERVPLDWAQTQNDLGLALATLGEREADTAHLEEAVAMYHLALEERTRKRVPLDWAQTQDN